MGRLMNGGDARGVPYTAYHTFDEFTFYNDSSGLKKEIPRPDFSYQPFAMNVTLHYWQKGTST